MKALQTVYSLPMGEMESIQTPNWHVVRTREAVAEADLVFDQK
jgi:hypothetical protein